MTMTFVERNLTLCPKDNEVIIKLLRWYVYTKFDVCPAKCSSDIDRTTNGMTWSTWDQSLTFYHVIWKSSTSKRMHVVLQIKLEISEDLKSSEDINLTTLLLPTDLQLYWPTEKSSIAKQIAHFFKRVMCDIGLILDCNLKKG